MERAGHHLAPVELDIPHLPPSLNTLAGKGSGRHKYTRAKREWAGILLPLLAMADMPKCDQVTVEGRCTFPDQRRRDQGNFRFFIEKALGDSLVQGGYLPDDTWDRYEFGGLARGYEKGERRTELRLFPVVWDAPPGT